MKNMIKYISVIVVAVLMCSCKGGFMDINKNPNYPETVTDPLMLLPSGQIQVAAIVGGDMELVGSLWSQHYTQNNASNQYNTTVDYSITNTSYQRFWSIPYAGAIPDLTNAVKYSAAAGNADNLFVASETMLCFMYHILGSWYGDIPYTEAALGNANLTPKFDEGSAINDDLIKRLENVISKATSAANAAVDMSGQDIVFGGSVKNWIAFAKTLRLKLMMRNWSKYSSTIATALDAGGFLTTDAKIATFVNEENHSNPLFENDRRKLNTTRNMVACNTLANYLRANADPRIKVFYDKTSGAYPSNEAGYRLATGIRYSRATLAATDPVYFMSEAESYFLQAEAWARLDNASKAQSFYEAGVKAAFDRWGYDCSTFIATGGVYAFDATSQATMLKCILTQKWVAATRCQAWDSFFDITRTGIPALGTKLTSEAGYVSGELVPVVDSSLPADQFPHRMLYPKSSSDYNTNTPTVKIEAKQWWQK
jgi:hypothetical protein